MYPARSAFLGILLVEIKFSQCLYNCRILKAGPSQELYLHYIDSLLVGLLSTESFCEGGDSLVASVVSASSLM